MPMPDADIHPHATGKAEATVKAHSKKVGEDGVNFYAGWFCPFVQRTWIALEEKGIDYYYEEINPYHKDESYLAINPKGLVPSLRRNGKSLAESDVLVEYLEDAFPGTKPLFSRESAEDKALTRMTIDLIAKKIVPASFKTLQTQDEEGQKKARKEYVDGVKEFASRIKEGQTYHGGKDIDAADVSLAPWATREYLMEEHRGGPFTEEEVGSKYMAWKKAMLSRPSIINTMSEKDKYAPIYGRYLRDEAQSDAAKATRGGRVIP